MKMQQLLHRHVPKHRDEETLRKVISHQKAWRDCRKGAGEHPGARGSSFSTWLSKWLLSPSLCVSWSLTCTRDNEKYQMSSISHAFITSRVNDCSFHRQHHKVAMNFSYSEDKYCKEEIPQQLWPELPPVGGLAWWEGTGSPTLESSGAAVTSQPPLSPTTAGAACPGPPGAAEPPAVGPLQGHRAPSTTLSCTRETSPTTAVFSGSLLCTNKWTHKAVNGASRIILWVCDNRENPWGDILSAQVKWFLPLISCDVK